MLRIRHLLIHINTDKGVFGTRQNFADGLNVIRAENYAGKSQLVQSIMYALGMEGMQGPCRSFGPCADGIFGLLRQRKEADREGDRFDGLVGD
jgi:hypothetical protein